MIETIDDAVAVLLGAPLGSQSPAQMTPERYAHASQLVAGGASSLLVVQAVNKINASARLQKPIADVTAEDIEAVRKLAAARGATS